MSLFPNIGSYNDLREQNRLLQAEIERLRGLVRDLLPGIDDYWREVEDGPRIVAEAEAVLRGEEVL